jgi:hypothetical protein
MRNLIVGFILGGVLMSGLPVLAGSKIYGGKDGGPKISQYDYFRSRQGLIDLSSIRRMQEREAAEARAKQRYSPYLDAPCGK